MALRYSSVRDCGREGEREGGKEGWGWREGEEGVRAGENKRGSVSKDEGSGLRGDMEDGKIGGE